MAALTPIAKTVIFMRRAAIIFALSAPIAAGLLSEQIFPASKVAPLTTLRPLPPQAVTVSVTPAVVPGDARAQFGPGVQGEGER